MANVGAVHFARNTPENGNEMHPAKVVQFISTNFLAFHFEMQLQMASLNASDQRELYESF